MDEITENEMEEIWKSEDPDENETIRLNGKLVWVLAKCVCDFINTHEDFIKISTIEERRIVMRKVSKVIKEADNRERKRRQTARKENCDETKTRTQQAKSLIANIKQCAMRKEIVEIL